MKKNVLWSLALGASLTVSGAAVLHGCGSGISPVDLATTDEPEVDPDAAFSISPTTGNVIGGFTLTITSGTMGDLTGGTVTVGGVDCPLRSTANSTQIKCRAPELAAGSYDVRVSTSAGNETLTSSLTYDTSIKFSRDIQPMFEYPLRSTDGTTANNVTCIFCHSPPVPITGTDTSTACNAGGSSTCEGRLSFGGVPGSYAAASGTNNITTSGGASLDDTSASKTLGAGSTVTFPKGSTYLKLLANAYDPGATGYAFNCTNLKTALGKDASLSTVADPMLSKLYLKIAGTSAGTKMPQNSSTVARDARYNPNAFTAAQLAALVQWYNSGNGTCD